MSEDAGVIEKDVVVDDKAGSDAGAGDGVDEKASGAGDVDAGGAGDKSAGDDKAGAKDDAGDKQVTWPDNWRDELAAGDEDTLKLLKRYGSPKGVAKALKEKEALIRSGKVVRTEKPDPTDVEATKEWNKQQGIPDDPTGYVFPETVQKRMTDADKPLLSSFTEYAHAKGAPQSVIDIASEWYFDQTEALEAAQIATDKKNADDAEESLRKEWGAEFKGNKSLGERFIESIPGLGADLRMARVADGRLLRDIPEFVAWASDQGRERFGDPVFATSDGESRHNNRKAEIEKIMSTDFQRYEREGLAAEYAQILEREEKRKK